jgi:tripartite-type tricarboxylate transporter receptor subunit TctC
MGFRARLGDAGIRIVIIPPLGEPIAMKATSLAAHAIVIAALGAWPQTLAAQSAGEYPSRPIRLIIPEVPGSATDAIAGLLAQRLGEALGQPMHIDRLFDKASVQAALAAPPDGYTLLIGGNATMVVAPQVDRASSYDPFTDLVPISSYTRMPYLFVVHPSLPVSNVQQFIALARAKPGELKMASAGVGQGSHLGSAMFALMTSIDTPHTPYEGGGPSIAAVVDNRAQWTITPMAGPLPHVRAGRLKALAVGSATRAPALPDLPTVAEQGVPGYSVGFWGGLYLPKGAPAAIVERLNAAVVKVLDAPEVKEQFLARGAEAVSSTPAELTQFMREEHERMGKVLRTVGLVKD